MASQPPAPRKRPASAASTYAMVIELPFVLVAAVVMGGGLGYLLDRALHTAPAMLLVFGLLGFAGGLWEILKRLSRAEKKEQGGDG